MPVMTNSAVSVNGLVFNNDVIRVVQEIMSASAHVNLTAEPANEEIERTYPSFVTGIMILHGERDIVLTLTFSKNAAADLVVGLLGVKYNHIIETEVYDAVMETTNMIAGRLKTAAINLGTNYQLTTPLVFIGPNHFLGAKTRPAGIVKKFKDKHFEMLASVLFL